MGGSASKDDGNKVDMLNAAFLWKTKNYSQVPLDNWVKSPAFAISTLSYHLELQRNDDLQIRLHGIQTSSIAAKFRCKISVLDKLGHEYFTKLKEITIKQVSEDEVIWSIKKIDLEQKNTKFLPDDTLTISFKITAINCGEPSGDDSAVFLETLSNDLRKFLEDKIQTDCVLNADNTTFPAHRAVLSARSKVFEAMFRHDTAERRSGKVNIPDVDAHILEEVLHYIYTGKVARLSADAAHAMYMVADKYGLAELKEECVKSLISTLTVDNICKAAVLSDYFELAPLKRAIVKLVQGNRDKVLKSENWGTFSIEKPIIANSILSETLLASTM